MKHAGSNEELQNQSRPAAPETPAALAFPGIRAMQSRTSVFIALAFGLLLVAIVVDAPVRSLAQSLDPSLKSVLRYITNFGNSAWPLGTGLALLVIVAVLRRRKTPFSPDELLSLRSALLLLVVSVALSGVLANLAKNVIGRIRPSTDPGAEVLEFAFLSFKAGWASFPSGHATTATASALALAISFPRQSWAWLSIGLVAALSRAFLGVHWFTDCLAGMALGAAVTLTVRKMLVARGHRLQVGRGILSRVLVAATVECKERATLVAKELRKRVVAPRRRTERH